MRVLEQNELLEAAEPLIDLALAEDGVISDLTSQATFPEHQEMAGWIVARCPGVIAGLAVAEAVFHRVDPEIQFEARIQDGWPVREGERIARLRGRARSVLAAERTALNFLQRLSGIATATAGFVDAAACFRARILDTRKTCPGFRRLDKYAVRMGGGENHRMTLQDMIMIKDNHIEAAGGILPAVERVRERHSGVPTEVEVQTLDQLQEVLAIDPPVARILCDNMDVETLHQAVALTAGRIPLEASGTMTLERAEEVASTGVDFISVGRITHSVEALDLSLEASSATDGVDQDWQIAERIRELKKHFGDQVVLLAHHYQRDEIVDFCDFRGDSLELVRSAVHVPARYIVFCGVHFMAETAAILSSPGQRVILPEQSAGCYLADTARLQEVEQAWQTLDSGLEGASEKVMPITYVNSSAALKAFCGQYGGYVCTSANARTVLEQALTERPRVFFFPDRHLGWNTSVSCGIPENEILIWNRLKPPAPDRIRSARVILWPGACNVHQRFRPEMVESVRKHFPGVRVIVHPECDRQVVDAADEAGSTSRIIRRIGESPAGSLWAIGTESRLVNRLQQEYPDKKIMLLSPVPAVCPTMSATSLSSLVSVLEELAHGWVPNEIRVDEETARQAKAALNRMLSL